MLLNNNIPNIISKINTINHFELVINENTSANAIIDVSANANVSANVDANVCINANVNVDVPFNPATVFLEKLNEPETNLINQPN
jgi:hypothetical protein